MIKLRSQEEMKGVFQLMKKSLVLYEKEIIQYEYSMQTLYKLKKKK